MNENNMNHEWVGYTPPHLSQLKSITGTRVRVCYN